MQYRRRAEKLIVNLRWVALLAAAYIIDAREARAVLFAIPLSLFLYNLIAYYICSSPELYQRFSFWPGYAARGLDLAAATFLATRVGTSENTVFLLYSVIIVGAGFVYGVWTALGACAISAGLFYIGDILSGTPITFGFESPARLAFFPASVLVGAYLSREFEREWTRRESYKRLEGIYQLGSSFNEQLDTKEILQKTIQIALRLTYADKCVMTLFSEDGTQVTRRAELTRPSIEEACHEHGHAIVTEFQSQVQASSKPSESEAETVLQPTTRIETPLSVGSKIVGKLEVESWNPEIKLGDNEAQLLTILATQAAIAIQNARMVENLQMQAETDPLTGLLNRRVLSQRIPYEIGLALEKSYPLAIWISDIDGFKAINDNYGHPAGDKILQQVGQMLPKTIRDGDVAFRYGGDEFLVVLRRADIGNALAAANRIKNTLESTHIGIGKGKQITIKLSGGLSCTSVDGYDSSDLVARADDRLLRAKHCGKNRIYGPNESPLMEEGI